MGVTRNQILDEIRRTTLSNGGVPLGVARFAAETDIKYTDWFGVYWARWGDALKEAGFEPNTLQGAYDTEFILQQYAELALELDRLPVRGDLKLKRRQDSTFPSWNVFSRLGSKPELLRLVADFCQSDGRMRVVAEWCEAELVAADQEQKLSIGAEQTDGYVYLIQHGARREYKIGRTNNPLRREGEIGIELPEKVKPLHVIRTDDPAGIEAYWHRRFADQRKNGEWFALSQSDIRAFKRRRFM